MRSFRFGFALCAAVTTLSLAHSASAGPVERLVEFSADPADSKLMVVGYDNGGGGLLYSRDEGHNFELVCVSAIEPTLRQRGTTVIAGDGKMLMGFFSGLWQDNGSACAWAKVPEFEGKWVSDIATHPTDPGVTFAITSMAGVGDAKADNGLYKRDAAGAWTAQGARTDLLLSSLRIATLPTGIRVYETGFRTGTAMVDGSVPDSVNFVRHSDDMGMTWTEHMFTDTMAGRSISLVGVDPTNPDRILLSVVRDTTTAVLVSADKGMTWQDYASLTEFGGVAFAPDGQVWLGEPASVTMPSASKGLWHAANLMEKPTKIGDYGVQCLFYQPTAKQLYACQAFAFGTVDAASGAFEERVKFQTVKEFASCPGMDAAAACKIQLCKDYCGPGHFAQAPMCCAYTDATCGPMVAEQEGTGSQAMCLGGATSGAGGSAGAAAGSGGTAGSTSAGGSTSSAGTVAAAGASGASSPAGRGGSSAAAGAVAPPTSGSSGGCSCATLGERKRESAGWWAGLAAIGLAAGLRRRVWLRRSSRLRSAL